MVLSLFTIAPISVGAAEASPVDVQADNSLYVKSGDNVYEVKKGEIITYNYYLSTDNAVKISSFDINMSYDSGGLELIPFTDGYGDINTQKHFPYILGNCISNFAIDGKIYFNYSSVNGLILKTTTPLFTCQFKVTADKGTYEISENIVTLADKDMNKIVYNEEVLQDIFTEKSEIAEKTPVRDTVQKDTKTVYLLNNAEWTDVYAYYWGSDSVNCEYWPGEAMKLYNDKGKYDIYSITVPNDIKGIVFNGFEKTSLNNQQTNTLLDSQNGDCYYLLAGDPLNLFFETGKDDINDIIAKNNSEIVTHTYTVAGGLFNTAGIFGTTWDPKNTANDMTLNANTGVWSIRYTNVPSTGADWYEYKIAQDHSFDVSFGVNNGPSHENGKIKVATDNSTVTIYFDGKICWSVVEEPAKIKTKTIYFLNNREWDEVKAYYWGSNFKTCTDWPGEALKLYNSKGKYEIYSIAVPIDATGIIFNGMNTFSRENNQTNDLHNPQDGDCYYTVGETSVNHYESEKDSIANVVKNNTIEEVTHTYTVAGDARLCGTWWDPSNESNDLTYDEKTKLWSITYKNVDTITTGVYEYKLVEDHSWDRAFTDKGVDLGGDPNATFTVDADKSTVTIYFDGKKCWAKVETNEISTETPEKHVYVVVDGKKHEVNKGDIFTYKYMLSVDEALRISSLDINILYDTKGLDSIPYIDEYEDVDVKKHFPRIFAGCINNFGIDGEIYFNYSNVAGVKLADNAVVFTGQFEVTADEGTYNINSTLVTLADSNLNKIVYQRKIIQPDAYKVTTALEIKKPDDTDQPEIPEIPETPESPQSPDGLYIKIGNSYYEVKPDEEYEFVYTLNAGENRISTVDARVSYNTEGLEFIPVKDSFNELDLSYMLPELKAPVLNHTIDGMILFNSASAYGSSLNHDDSILFRAKFKVTATNGVYEINPYIHCLEDEAENIIVNEGVVCGEYKENAFIKYSGPCIKIGNNYYEAVQGEEYEFVHYLQVEDCSIGSIDARVMYDTEGLDFVPANDAYGEHDLSYIFPLLKGPVYNFDIDGTLYFNYSNIKGTQFKSEKSVLFRGRFKVTADKGVYEIKPYIYCLADTDLRIIVNEGVTYGEFKESAVLKPKYEIGDVNLDGKVSVFDITEVQRYAAGFIELNENQMRLCDMNKDGNVNIFDATAIARYIANFG